MEDICIPKFKHGDDPDSDFDAEQLAIGIEVEKEHSDNVEIAKQIAKAHLAEFDDYYIRLAKMEKEAKEAKDKKIEPKTNKEGGYKMPIPTPKKDESQKDFINRCMGNDTMVKEYPDQKQRAAICFNEFRTKRNAQITNENDFGMVFMTSDMKMTSMDNGHRHRYQFGEINTQEANGHVHEINYMNRTAKWTTTNEDDSSAGHSHILLD